MADYSAIIRTNYFHVKDKEKFLKMVPQICAEGVIEVIRNEEDADAYALGVNGPIQGICTDPDGEADYDGFLGVLQECVADNDAILLLETGHEKLHSVVGAATVITRTGIRYLDLWNLAREHAKRMLCNPDWDTRCDC